jgi:hypothetical protein
MATVILMAVVIGATVLTVKFAVSEGLLGRGRVGGGMEVRTSRKPREKWIRIGGR